MFFIIIMPNNTNEWKILIIFWYYIKSMEIKIIGK